MHSLLKEIWLTITMQDNSAWTKFFEICNFKWILNDLHQKQADTLRSSNLTELAYE